MYHTKCKTVLSFRFINFFIIISKEALLPLTILAYTTIMSPRSSIIDHAFDVAGDNGFDNSSTSDISSLDFSNVKRSQSQLLSISEKQLKPKSVCYAEFDKVIEISHRKDFSQKKIGRLWYSFEEQCEMRAECRALVQRFNDGELMEKDILFGLEKQTKAGLEPVVKLRQVINETVFNLQKVLKSGAKADLIAKFYETSCAKSTLEARLSAMKLAVEVKIEIGLSKTIQRVKI
jgi:hypothetical protein